MAAADRQVCGEYSSGGSRRSWSGGASNLSCGWTNWKRSVGKTPCLDPPQLPPEIAQPTPCGGQLKHLGEDVFGDAGVGSGKLQSYSAGAVKSGLWALQQDRAGRSIGRSERTRNDWSGIFGARAGGEVLRSLAVVLAGRNSRARGTWNWIARHWPIGWAVRANCFSPWGKLCGATC